MAKKKAATKKAATKKTAKKKTPTKKGVKKTPLKAKKIPKLCGNGLETFGMHTVDKKSANVMKALAKETAKSPAFAFAPAAAAQPHDPEASARRYLQQALASKAVPKFNAPSANNLTSEFARLGVERIPLTKSTTVKFRQTYSNVPVYGSLVTVELDDANELIGINSALGTPQGVSPVAKIAPAEALAAVKKQADGKPDLSGAVPRIYYYYDQGKTTGKWKLVYILEDIPVVPKDNGEEMVSSLKDYVVDAHTGKLVAELNRTPTVALKMKASDELGASRNIQVDKTGGVTTMINDTLNVQTFDFRLKDVIANESQLPGPAVRNPPTFSPGAVSAHANTEVVARFLRETLLRNNIDNKGGPLVASINCLYKAKPANPREWLNAFWNGKQVTYGQRDSGATLPSMAAAIDIVAHENFHGVTDETARLLYRFQSGALNESYSDIFGIIVKNLGNPDPRTWNWDIGVGMAVAVNTPIRNMQNPGTYGQPAHMAGYKNLPADVDEGGVHTNSGIHNKAAYNILTAEKGGALVFTPTEVAIVFYLALAQRLSRTSQFKDSRTAVVASARSHFRDFPAAQLNDRIAAIEKGFDEVGIV